MSEKSDTYQITPWSGGWEISRNGEVITQAERLEDVGRQIVDYLETVGVDTVSQHHVVSDQDEMRTEENRREL